MSDVLKLSAVFHMRLALSTAFFCASEVNGALTDLLFCLRRNSSSSSDGLKCDVHKQIEVIVIVMLYYLMITIQDGI